jgi:hypothetical protein
MALIVGKFEINSANKKLFIFLTFVLFSNSTAHRSATNFPIKQSDSVNVSATQRFETRHVDAEKFRLTIKQIVISPLILPLPFIQNLWCHVSLSADFRVMTNVNGSVLLRVCYSESKISDDALSVDLNENIFRLQVTMSNRRLPLLSENFCVKMNETAGNAEANCDHLVVAESCAVEMVIERAELIVVSDQPELRARVTRCHVRTNVAENVFVTQQNCTVDFRFALPRFLVATEENLYRDIFSMPNCAPNFSVATATNAF